MSRAVVTHFDGDPFLLNFFLTLYESYWRDEVNKLYVTINADKTIPLKVREFNRKLLGRYPEIEVINLMHREPPETGNQKSLRNVKEDYIGLIESDGFIFATGLVDQCFRLLENEGQDIVSPPWHLIDKGIFEEHQGFMRCFFFAKKETLDRVELDFLPHSINDDTYRDLRLDCFGWICWQLYQLEPKITYTPANVLNPDNILNSRLYDQWKWCHVRQMSSSGIGLGGGAFYNWSHQTPEFLDEVRRVISSDFINPAATFTYMKAVAFKLLMIDMLKDTSEIAKFAESYKEVMKLIVDVYQVSEKELYETKGFYKGIMKL